LLFAGGEFFTSAWRGILSRHLNIDVPLALSLLLTFFRSLYEISAGIGNGYLDSMTGIIFFMLIGRYFQHLTHHRIQFDRDYKSFFPISVTIRLPDNQETTIPLTKLKLGDTLMVRSSELIPADSMLLSEEAHIDYSFVTGESQPITIRKGAIIYAGGRLTGSLAQCEVVKDVSQSYLTNLWNKENYADNKTTRPWIDKLAQHFTLALLAISVLAFLYWFPSDIGRALDALTTVLIVACPCAVLLSATFTQGTMMRIFSRNGMYFKNTDALDRLEESDYFVLDKTGTLTGKDVEITYHGIELNKHQLSLIKGLAIQSNHPLSIALSEHLGNIDAAIGFINVSEIAGQGLSAMRLNQVIKIGSFNFCSNEGLNEARETAVHIRIDNIYIGYFEFHFAWRKGIEEALYAMKKRGPIAVVSGDNEHDAQRLKNLLGENAQLHFRQMPADKLEFVKSLENSGKRVTMIGDGLNDSGALLQSHCGISISDEVNNFSPACDVIVKAETFSKLPSLLALTRCSRYIIYISFGISLLYNVIGVGLAVQGKMEP
jgi:Cu+-exporting ATPase